MKKLVLAMCLLVLSTYNISYARERKQVCRSTVIKNKPTVVCKKIKIHKKLSGTKVPTRKK